MTRTPLPPADFTPAFENYTAQKLFRFWCQTVLPLVYDDSLSFYELLNKVVVYLNNTIKDVSATETNVERLLTAFNELQDYVNEYFYSSEQIIPIIDQWLTDHPEATTTVQDNSITVEKLNKALQDFIFGNVVYTVTDYRIFPDTDLDLYDQLFDLFHLVNDRGGGIIFFPIGKYDISDTLFIPPNTTIRGAGKDTILNFTAEYTYFGALLTNGGDNVSVENLSVEHVATENIRTTSGGSYIGGIGYSNFDFIGWTIKHGTQFSRRATTNLKAIDIYSESTYVLQTEPSSDFPITGVIYSNIYAPDSLVSLHPQSGNGVLSDVYADNIKCALFRCGVGHRKGKNINVSNLICAEIYLADSCNLSNFHISDAYGEGWKWYDYALVLGSTGIIENGLIENTGVFTYAIGNFALADMRITLNNISTRGFNEIFTTPATISTYAYFYLNECDFEGKPVFMQRGHAIGCNCDPRYGNYPFKNFDELTTRQVTEGYTIGSNSRWSDSRWPCRLTRNGNTVHIQGVLTLTDRENLLTLTAPYIKENLILPLHMLEFNTTTGTVVSTGFCIAKCDANGVFKIDPLFQDISRFNRVVFSMSYNIG